MDNDNVDLAPEQTVAQAMQVIAQQAAAIVELQQAMALMASGGRPSARGAGERIKMVDLVAKAKASMTTTTARTYSGYMDLLVEDKGLVDAKGEAWKGLGDMWADDVLPSDLEKALEVVGVRAQVRAEERAQVRDVAGRAVRSSKGDGARYNAIGAWRRTFEVAIANRHLAKGMNPAADLKKPKRVKGVTRLALKPALYEQMVELISSTGDDPELDEMIVRFIEVTGARQEGVVNLHVEDIDLSECTVCLHEKFGTSVQQPVPDWFITELLAFARRRGATKRGDQVFRRRARSGQFEDITRRRFNYIFCDRLQASFDWADRVQVTAHTLRHHAVTKVERHAGRAVAGAFARHVPEGTTDIYTVASRREVAQAVIDLHGGDHPWLHREPMLAR